MLKSYSDILLENAIRDIDKVVVDDDVRNRSLDAAERVKALQSSGVAIFDSATVMDDNTQFLLLPPSGEGDVLIGVSRAGYSVRWRLGKYAGDKGRLNFPSDTPLDTIFETVSEVLNSSNTMENGG